MPTRRTPLLSFAGTLLVGVGVASALLWQRAQHAWQDAGRQAKLSATIPFQLAPLTPTVVPAGFQSLGANAGFESFALYDGEILICNRSSLFRYSSDGRLLQTWRVGLDLPPFPLVGLAVRQGIPQPELWVATDGAGALIWDGRIFRQFAPRQAPLRKLTALLPLPGGSMLLGTLHAGLYVTDARQFSLFHPELKDVPVSALARGPGEDLWIGTRTAGVWLWRAGTLTRFVDELPDPQILSICAGEAGVWAGTATGVAEFVDGRFRRQLAAGVFARALAEKAGTLWIATIDQGTLSINLRSHTPRPSAGKSLAGPGALPSVALLSVADGVLSLGPADIRRLWDGGEVLEVPANGLTSAHITALTVDQRRRLWIGYFDRGVDVLSGGSPASVRHFESEVLFCINRLKQHPLDGRMFVATANGLALFDGEAQARQVLRTSDGLIANHVTDILFRETAAGTASTAVATSAGISFLEGAGATSIYAFQGLVNNHVYTLASAGPLLLAGTLGGVSLVKNGLVQTSFTTANSELRQNWITSSTVSGDDIYLGTYGSGVVRLNAQFQVQVFREFTGKRIEINQNAMLATAHGVYAGTAGQGLAFLPSREQRWHFWESGLPSNNVTALAADGGDLFIGTDNGLIRIPERSLGL